MNQLRGHRAILALVAIVSVLATLLAVQCFRSEPKVAYGQGESVSANYVLALLGSTTSDRTPLFLVDTKAQTIMVYEYTVSTRGLYLRDVRSYASDRELQDAYFNINNNVYQGPTVKDIQNILRSGGGR